MVCKRVICSGKLNVSIWSKVYPSVSWVYFWYISKAKYILTHNRRRCYHRYWKHWTLHSCLVCRIDGCCQRWSHLCCPPTNADIYESCTYQTLHPATPIQVTCRTRSKWPMFFARWKSILSGHQQCRSFWVWHSKLRSWRVIFVPLHFLWRKTCMLCLLQHCWVSWGRDLCTQCAGKLHRRLCSTSLNHWTKSSRRHWLVQWRSLTIYHPCPWFWCRTTLLLPWPFPFWCCH